MEPALRILPARIEDTRELLDIQIEAFATVAHLYGMERVPPMDETPEEFLAAIVRGGVLKAVVGGRSVGAVRGTPNPDGTVLVGRLCVRPGLGRSGAGRALMLAIEDLFPDATRFVLYTGERTPHTRRLYESIGYAITHDEIVQGDIRLLWMAKENV
jgi:GNAT superfamily N-acetyltransferase